MCWPVDCAQKFTTALLHHVKSARNWPTQPLNSERCSHAQELKNPHTAEENAAVGGVDEVRAVTDGKDFVGRGSCCTRAA